MALLQLGTGKEAKLQNSGKHGPLKKERIQRSCYEALPIYDCFHVGWTSRNISRFVVIVQWSVVVYLIRHGRQKSTSMARWEVREMFKDNL